MNQNHQNTITICQARNFKSENLRKTKHRVQFLCGFTKLEAWYFKANLTALLVPNFTGLMIFVSYRDRQLLRLPAAGGFFLFLNTYTVQNIDSQKVYRTLFVRPLHKFYHRTPAESLTDFPSTSEFHQQLLVKFTSKFQDQNSLVIYQ